MEGDGWNISGALTELYYSVHASCLKITDPPGVVDNALREKIGNDGTSKAFNRKTEETSSGLMFIPRAINSKMRSNHRKWI